MVGVRICLVMLERVSRKMLSSRGCPSVTLRTSAYAPRRHQEMAKFQMRLLNGSCQETCQFRRVSQEFEVHDDLLFVIGDGC